MIRIQPKPYSSINEAFRQLSLEFMIDSNRVELYNAEGCPATTYELLNYQLIFEPNYRNQIIMPSRKWKVDKAIAEFLWYMTGKLSTAVITKYIPNWKRFSHNGYANSNYGYYWKRHHDYIINELKQDKNSRRAVISLYNADNHDKFYKDTICTLSYQFIIRKGTVNKIHDQTVDRLHMIVNMRSNDFWYGFSNDQFLNSLFHQLMLNELREFYPELQMGDYIHNAVSLHVYDDTCGPAKLQQLYEESLKIKDIENAGERFELDSDLTLNNFWEHKQFKEYNPEMFKDFYDHLKFQVVNK